VCASNTRSGASVTAEHASGAPTVSGGERSPSHLPVALTLGALWLVADQATKTWAEWALADGPIDLVWTLRLRLVTNTGASFSIGDGFGPLIGVVALVVVAGLLWTGRSVSDRTGAVGLGLVLGGALGNILDRAVRSTDGFLGGGVIDFIDVQWWPVFNVADIGVVVGAVLLLVSGIRSEVRLARDEREESVDAIDQEHASRS
jgi:signal peptidase II